MRRTIAWIVLGAVLAAASGAGEAWARNFHISGGIQYVVQGDKEKAKGLLDDARRIYGKAVVQLLQGIAEAPDDLEAWDYLGRAYAELDSTERAGWAFASGIALACPKSEEKKLCRRLEDNRKYYWNARYQAALETFKLAEAAASPEAQRNSALDAAAKMRQAIQIWPGEASSYCNLAAIYAKAEDYATAMQVTQEGLQAVPGDSCLVHRKNDLTIVLAERAAQSGEFDSAIAAYEKVLAADPGDAVTANRLGELYFQKGGKLSESGDAAGAKASYANAAKNFGIYYYENAKDENALYNYALAQVRAGEFQAAAKTVHTGLLAWPASTDLHGLMAEAYTGLGMTEEATKHRLVTLVVREGVKSENPEATADSSVQAWGAASDAARLLQKLGPPEEVRRQTRGEHDVELWAWWSKFHATTMVKGRTVSDLDFSQVASPAASAKKS
jgi:tetratricopeptide (TPR) repeat protein